MENVRKAVETYLQAYPPALKLFQELMNVGKVYMIGGVLREYRDHHTIKELRDADFIVEVQHVDLWREMLETYKPIGNHFDGYKFNCEQGFLVDIWEMDKTWAYQKNIIAYDKANYIQTLPETVFLNMDSIIYDLSENRWYDKIYQEAIRTGVLDIVLKENPHVELNILRALILKRKYDMRYSDKLERLIMDHVNANEDFVQMLLDIQNNRYHKEVLSREQIEWELQMFSNI